MSPQARCEARKVRRQLVFRATVRSQRGQALVEAALVMVILMIFSIGVFSFGYTAMLSNAITNAARAGARMAAVTPMTARDPNGFISDTQPIVDFVVANLSPLDDASDPQWSNAMTVTVSQDDGVNVNTVSVRIQGDVPMPIPVPNGLGQYFSSIPVDRVVSFPDQGRP